MKVMFSKHCNGKIGIPMQQWPVSLKFQQCKSLLIMKSIH